MRFFIFFVILHVLIRGSARVSTEERSGSELLSSPLIGQQGSHNGDRPGKLWNNAMRSYAARRALMMRNTTCIVRYFDGTKVRLMPRSELEYFLLCHRIRRGDWEASTFRIIKEFVTRTTSYIDVGAWVGPMTLFAASQSRMDVYSFEPDPDAYAALKTNVRLNPNLVQRVHAYHRCVADTPGKRELFGDVLGSSKTSLYTPNATSHFSINCIMLPELCVAQHIRPPYFVKMDCEGCEQMLLPSWQRFLQFRHRRIVLFISMHQKYVGKFSEESLQGIRSVFQIFKFVFEVVEEKTYKALEQRSVDDSFTVCDACSYVLTSRRPRGEHIKLKFLSNVTQDDV
eukprot:NODE_2734_length_1132_cov_28.462604_g2511_i0.p1 GENE.NODE_2734_length_1132_cov_28.462604_g2511_i0~~NODE_2734_length_1132_cov_28.462604_g2511_i0.p1  ORF type:complete len:342 (+),score=55.83 NODE_2734_length_1132_cov_28.462604_g2511_i0:53-1078(+)